MNRGEVGMITWNEIITMPATPEQRLNKLIGVWKDILEIYRNPRMMYFDPDTFLAVVEPNYNRYLYPSNTTSILKSGPTNYKPSIDQNVKLLTEDDRSYRLVKGLSKIFNQSLDKEQREVMARRSFYGESQQVIRKACGLSRCNYFRILKKAKINLIMNYCLDHYDEYGIERHNWVDVSKERRQWNNGHFFKEDMRDWPEFQEA